MCSLRKRSVLRQVIRLGGSLEQLVEEVSVYQLLKEIMPCVKDILRLGFVVFAVLERRLLSGETTKHTSCRILNQSRNRGGECLSYAKYTLVITLTELCGRQFPNDILDMDFPEFIYSSSSFSAYMLA